LWSLNTQNTARRRLFSHADVGAASDGPDKLHATVDWLFATNN